MQCHFSRQRSKSHDYTAVVKLTQTTKIHCFHFSLQLLIESFIKIISPVHVVLVSLLVDQKKWEIDWTIGQPRDWPKPHGRDYSVIHIL